MTTNATAVLEDLDETFSLDDMLSDVVAGVPAHIHNMTSEERFYHDLTSANAKFQKIFNCRYWLNHQLSVFCSMMGDNPTWLLSKPHKAQRIGVSVQEVAREFLRYYMQSNYLTRFTSAIDGRKPCDMNMVLDMVLDHPEIKRTIGQYHA